MSDQSKPNPLMTRLSIEPDRAFQLPSINLTALETDGQRMQAEQLAEARVIKINPWFTERARETVADFLFESGTLTVNRGETEADAYRRFLAEMGMDPDKPKLAHAGRSGEARNAESARQQPRNPPSNFLEVRTWTAYLEEVASRRSLGHLLIQDDRDGGIGFIDHEEDLEVFIEGDELRAWRRTVRFRPHEMILLAEAGKHLGLESAEAALAVSRSPTTRAAILGWSPYGGEQSFLPNDWASWPSETVIDGDLENIFLQEQAEVPTRESLGLGAELALTRPSK